MSYQLNKTNGAILTELIDGQIDTESTNLTLVGRNFTGYGEAFNENFIKLLENFANTAAPSNPLTGQLWWNTSAQRLQVYDGAQWKASGGPFVQSSQPVMVAGDLWINDLTNQFFSYDGTDLTLIGPLYTEQQGISGFEVVNVRDLQSRLRPVVKLYVGGRNNLVAVISNLEFTPQYAERILELVNVQNPNGIIFKGINIVDQDNFKLLGIATGANALITSEGDVVTAGDFLSAVANDSTIGTIDILNNGGLTIGLNKNNKQYVFANRFRIENQFADEDISLRVVSSALGGVTVDTIYIDASTARIGIFNNLPQYTLDVSGDLRVTGNLLVEGATTSIEVSTLKIEDKNIELATFSDSVVGDDTAADGGGIILKSSTGDKTILWDRITNSWTSNKSFDLDTSALHYSIGNSIKLTNTSLTNILYANDLIQIGTLINLDVDDININGTTISNDSGPINISTTNGINLTGGSGQIAIVDNKRITGMADPLANQDAATKIYVDTEVANETIVFSLDITGLGVGVTLQNNVRAYLTDLYTPGTINTGKFARIHTVSYSGATVTGINVSITTQPNTTGVLTKSYIAVDSNGTQNEAVVQDIVSSNTATGAVVLSPIRGLMVYQSNGVSWGHISTSNYP